MATTDPAPAAPAQPAPAKPPKAEPKTFTPSVMTPQQATAAALAAEMQYNKENGITFGGELPAGGRFVHEDGQTLHDAHGNVLSDEADSERAAAQSRAEAEANKRAIAAMQARESKSQTA